MTEKLGFISKEEWDKRGDSTPIGFIGYFSSNIAPDGYLICDGAEISRTFYKGLFDVIGTTYGEGDGSTTFNVPNLIDKFPQGSKIVGTEIEQALPNITGAIRFNSDGGFISGDAASYAKGALKTGGTLGYTFLVSGTGNPWTKNNNGRELALDASKSNSIYKDGANVQPPALTLLPCIKAVNVATPPTETDIKGIAALIIDTLYPIGSYSFGVKPNIGVWEEVEGDRALWLKNSVDDGTEIEQALPNITARAGMNYVSNGGDSPFADYEGAFGWSGTNIGSTGRRWPNVGGVGDSRKYPHFTFNASASNSIYKNGANVQPNAYVIKVYKRIA